MAQITNRRQRTEKQFTKKTITDKQRQKTGMIVPKINLDKTIQSMARFSSLLQQLAKIANCNRLN
jgi:hypothetical protein